MLKKVWGNEIWEKKALSHSPIQVILGFSGNEKKLKKNTEYNFNVLKENLLPLLSPKAKMLDVGIGPLARFAVLLAKSGFEVTGLDISDTSLKKAKRIADAQNLSLQFVQDDFCNYESPTQFDVIYSLETFYHIPASLFPIAFARFNKNLKPGGLLHVQFEVLERWTPVYLFKMLTHILVYTLLRPLLFAVLKKESFYVNVTRSSISEIKDLAGWTGFELIKQTDSHFTFRKCSESKITIQK